MDEDGIKRALRDILDGDQPPTSVQKHDLEMFDLIKPILFPEQVRHFLGSVQNGRVPVSFLAQALGQKESALDRFGFALADAGDLG